MSFHSDLCESFMTHTELCIIWMFADDCVTDLGAVNVVLNGCVRGVGLKIINYFHDLFICSL